MSGRGAAWVSEGRRTGTPVATTRKPVEKDYGTKGEYAMTAYERRRLERKGLLPTTVPPRGAVPGAADRDATPAPSAPAPPAGALTPS